MIEIPERLKRFQLWKGYVVHFTVFIKPDGSPDFKVMNEDNRVRCFEKNWCHLCGLRMWPPYAFIGGPLCVEHRSFVDGPMHVDCAEYAARVCPFLSSPTGKYNVQAGANAGMLDLDTNIMVYENVANVRPKKMALVTSDTYTWGRTSGKYGEGEGLVHAADPNPKGQITCKPGEYIRVDWDIMPSSD